MIGASVGGYLFAHVRVEWVQLCVAAFLISAVWQYKGRERARSFRMEAPWFLPLAIVSSLVSAVVGAGGLITTPFYLNHGLMKEALLATRAVNSLVIQVVKVAAYLTFGALSRPMVRNGLLAGVGAIGAIWLINPWLRHLSSLRFRQLAILVMLGGGISILWQQRWLLYRLGGLPVGWP